MQVGLRVREEAMDWVAIGTIAAIVSALAAAASAWVAYREYQDKKITGQPRSAQRSTPPLVDTSYHQSEHPDIDGKRRSPSQPRQVGTLSSKVARRTVLLGSTTLGLVLMFSGATAASPPLSISGISIVFVGSMFVWITSGAQGRAAWRRWSIWRRVGWVGFFMCLEVLLSCLLLSWCIGDLFLGISRWWWDYADGILFVMGFITYLTSIYIGRW